MKTMSSWDKQTPLLLLLYLPSSLTARPVALLPQVERTVISSWCRVALQSKCRPSATVTGEHQGYVYNIYTGAVEGVSPATLAAPKRQGTPATPFAISLGGTKTTIHHRPLLCLPGMPGIPSASCHQAPR